VADGEFKDNPGFLGAGHYFNCPLCEHLIKVLEPAEVPPTLAFEFERRDDENPLQAAIRYRIEQATAANEQLIWAHIETHHTLRDAVMALGVARNALRNLREVTSGWAEAEQIEEYVSRGLGGQ
jgi:hypothetical protein